MDVFHTPGAELLVKAVLSLETEEECRAFLEDLMTGKEIQDCSQRILVAKLLGQKLVYSRIARETGASSATISRVNRCCAYGAGGYRTVLERIGQSEGALTLRPVTLEDWETVQQLFLDFSASPFYYCDPMDAMDAASVKNWVQDMMRSHVMYAVCRRDNPAMIGYVCFHIDGEAYDIGYLFFSACQGHGYAAQAARAAMDALIAERRVRLFTATVSAENLPSVRVLEKLGFTLTSRRQVPCRPESGREGTFEERHYQYAVRESQ